MENLKDVVKISMDKLELIDSGVIPVAFDSSYTITIKKFKFTIKFSQDSNKDGEIKRTIVDKEKGIVEIEMFYSQQFGTQGFQSPLSIATVNGEEIYLSLYIITGYENKSVLSYYSLFKKEANDE